MIADFKIREVEVFLELVQVRSVRELARRKNLQPGQISKVIKSLEEKVNSTLFDRSIQGVNLTPSGRELLPFLQKLYDSAEELSKARSKQHHERDIHYTFASTSFFSTFLLSQVCTNNQFQKKGVRFSLLDLAPSELVQTGLLGGFQLSLHVDKIDWPKTWYTTKVGKLTWSLFARNNHPLHKSPTESKILKYPFVFPIYWTREGMKKGNDQCPVPIKKRIIGDQTATAISAIEIIKNSDQIGFLPDAFKSSEKKLKLIPVKKWPKVCKDVYLTVKSDKIPKQFFDIITQEIKKQLVK